MKKWKPFDPYDSIISAEQKGFEPYPNADDVDCADYILVKGIYGDKKYWGVTRRADAIARYIETAIAIKVLNELRNRDPILADEISTIVNTMLIEDEEE